MKMSKSHKGALSTSKPFDRTKHMVITSLCCKTPGKFYKNKTKSGVSAKSAPKVIKRILAQKRSRQRKKSFFQWKHSGCCFLTEMFGFKSRFINQKKKRGLKAGCCFGLILQRRPVKRPQKVQKSQKWSRNRVGVFNSVQEHSKSTYDTTRHIPFTYGCIFVKSRFKGDTSETSFQSLCEMAFFGIKTGHILSYSCPFDLFLRGSIALSVLFKIGF